jgi:hypothetical protein
MYNLHALALLKRLPALLSYFGTPGDLPFALPHAEARVDC